MKFVRLEQKNCGLESEAEITVRIRQYGDAELGSVLLNVGLGPNMVDTGLINSEEYEKFPVVSKTLQWKNMYITGTGYAGLGLVMLEAGLGLVMLKTGLGPVVLQVQAG